MSFVIVPQPPSDTMEIAVVAVTRKCGIGREYGNSALGFALGKALAAANAAGAVALQDVPGVREMLAGALASAALGYVTINRPGALRGLKDATVTLRQEQADELLAALARELAGGAEKEDTRGEER